MNLTKLNAPVHIVAPKASQGLAVPGLTGVQARRFDPRDHPPVPFR
jgi:hypothetical protein